MFIVILFWWLWIILRLKYLLPIESKFQSKVKKMAENYIKDSGISLLVELDYRNN